MSDLRFLYFFINIKITYGDLVLHFQVQLPRKEIVPIIVSPQNKKKKLKNYYYLKLHHV